MKSNNQHIEKTENIKGVIYYTLKEYKDNYNKTHELFINKHNDATELDFIQNQISNYKTYIENVTFIEWEYEPRVIIESEIKGENMVSEIIEQVKESKTKKIDYEKCNNFYYSFKAIITYLEDKRKEIQKPTQNNDTLDNKKETKTLVLQGRKLNLLERYEISRSILDIDNKIRTLNISDTEKYKLLGYILGCNSTNARHIMNGKYQGKIRESVINKYINSLKK